MYEPHELPDNTIHNADIQRSENGKLQMTMTAPLVCQYSKPESMTEYPEGVDMKFFDGYNNPTATLTAGYAVDYASRQQMMVRDSVVIIDLQRGDTIYLQDLTWDRSAHRIFSDKPLSSHNGDRVTYGDSFESDDDMKEPHILHQRGTMEWKEE